MRMEKYLTFHPSVLNRDPSATCKDRLVLWRQFSRSRRFIT